MNKLTAKLTKNQLIAGALILLLAIFVRFGLVMNERSNSVPFLSSTLSYTPSLNRPDFNPPTSGTVSEKLWMGSQADDLLDRLLLRQVGSTPLFTSKSEIELMRMQVMAFTPVNSLQDLRQSPLANERRLSDQRLWMNYNMLVLASRIEGDRLMFPLPNLHAVEAEIDRVELVNGHYRWSGRLLGINGRFSITHAMVDQYAVGTFITEIGEFLLEAKGSIGWVAHADQEFFHNDNDIMQ